MQHSNSPTQLQSVAPSTFNLYLGDKRPHVDYRSAGD